MFLGEHECWTKHTNFELGTLAPMMIHDPDITKTGLVVERLTEFVDLFPTLVELAGFPPLNVCPENSSKIELCTEGMSMVPLMKDPISAQWKTGAFSQYPRCKPGHQPRRNSHQMCHQEKKNKKDTIMGYTVRTERFRYTEWVRFSLKPSYKIHWGDVRATELYDHDNDPQEDFNLVDESSFRSDVEAMSEILRGGWRNTLPR